MRIGQAQLRLNEREERRDRQPSKAEENLGGKQKEKMSFHLDFFVKKLAGSRRRGKQ